MKKEAKTFEIITKAIDGHLANQGIIQQPQVMEQSLVMVVFSHHNY